MRLAKPRVDIGLSTNRAEALLPFWQGDVGAVFDHVLPIRRGQDQHRHDIAGSVLKINQHAEPLPPTPPSGYVELLVARDGLDRPVSLADPDGNRVTLVPPGADGVTQPYEGPGDVQRLAAGQPDHPRRPVDRAGHERVDGVDDVEGRGEPERVDHAGRPTTQGWTGRPTPVPRPPVMAASSDDRAP